MAMNSEHLTKKIIEFMTVIHECYSNTNFADDRSVYAKDITTAMGWIVKLKTGEDIQNVRGEILSPATDKHFCDYWRQGDWGDKEAVAFKKLKDNI